MKTIAIIIARGGSKGLIGKNMRLLAGKPLVAWTIEHALGCNRLADVAISTDIPEALEIAEKYGIRAYQRPAELAGDMVTIDAGVRHGAQCWADVCGVPADAVAIMYGNVAIRPDDLTDRAIAKLEATGSDSVQSVSPVGKMHPYWMRTLEGAGEDQITMYQPNRVYRRQDLPPAYMLDAGALVVRWSNLFTVDPAEPHAFLGDDRRGIVVPEGAVVDIDSTIDLRLAEAIIAERREQASPHAA